MVWFLVVAAVCSSKQFCLPWAAPFKVPGNLYSLALSSAFCFQKLCSIVLYLLCQVSSYLDELRVGKLSIKFGQPALSFRHSPFIAQGLQFFFAWDPITQILLLHVVALYYYTIRYYLSRYYSGKNN